jgi:hypothetical protein
MVFGTRSGVTLKSQADSAALQMRGLNMLRATWNPLKQWGLPMRLLCLPYFQESRGTHRFSGRGNFGIVPWPGAALRVWTSAHMGYKYICTSPEPSTKLTAGVEEPAVNLTLLLLRLHFWNLVR